MSHLSVGTWLLSLALATSTGCGRPQEDDSEVLVVGGVASALASVGRVLSNAGSCSGTLVAPKVVLTAHHCAGPGMRVQFPGKGTFKVIGSRAAPGVDMLLLKLEKVAPIKALPIAYNASALTPGASVNVVGYSAGFNVALGARTMGSVVFSRVQGAFNVFTPGRGHVCTGDSGGPFLSGGKIVGVASSIAYDGNVGPCVGNVEINGGSTAAAAKWLHTNINVLSR